MRTSTILSIIPLFAAWSYAACTRVLDAECNSLREVEECISERNSVNLFTGHILCTQANAWLRNGWNWDSRVSSPDNDVTFKIIPLTETGPLSDRSICHRCSAGTADEFVSTREGSFSVSVVA